MTGNPLPDVNHVSRYRRPATLSPKGRLLPDAFYIRENESFLSVNWVEYFQKPDFPAAIHRVREVFQAKGFRLAHRGSFAVLRVGAVNGVVNKNQGTTFRIYRMPSANDPSHAAIYGYGPGDFAVAAELAALVDPQDVYPAVI